MAVVPGAFITTITLRYGNGLWITRHILEDYALPTMFFTMVFIENLIEGIRMPHIKWFEGIRLNYAERCFYETQ